MTARQKLTKLGLMTHTALEYLSVRFSFKSRARNQEFSYLMVDGTAMTPDYEERLVRTLPELLMAVGDDGWDLITHTTTSAGHYMHFKRLKLAEEQAALKDNASEAQE